MGMTHLHDALISSGLIKVQLKTQPTAETSQSPGKSQVFEVTVVEQQRIRQQTHQSDKATASHLLKVTDGKHTISVQSERPLPVGTQLTLRLTPGPNPHPGDRAGSDAGTSASPSSNKSAESAIRLEILNISAKASRESAHSKVSTEPQRPHAPANSDSKTAADSRPISTHEAPNRVTTWVADKLSKSDWVQQRRPADTYQQALNSRYQAAAPLPAQPQTQRQAHSQTQPGEPERWLSVPPTAQSAHLYQASNNTPNNISPSSLISLLNQLARLSNVSSTNQTTGNLAALSSLLLTEGRSTGLAVRQALENSGLFLENKLVKAIFNQLNSPASGAPASPGLPVSDASSSANVLRSFTATTSPVISSAPERSGQAISKEATSTRTGTGLYISPEATGSAARPPSSNEPSSSQNRYSGTQSLSSLLLQQQQKINAHTNTGSFANTPHQRQKSTVHNLSGLIARILKNDLKGVLVEAIDQVGRTPTTQGLPSLSRAEVGLAARIGAWVGQSKPGAALDAGLAEFWRKKGYRLQPLTQNQPTQARSTVSEDIKLQLNKVLNELELEQIRQHPNGPFTKDSSIDCQIPVFYQCQNQIRQMLVEIGEKQPDKQSDGSQQNSWDIRLHFDLEEQGLLDVALSLKWPEVSAIFWVEQSHTLQAVMQNLPNIRERIQSLGGDIGDLEARRGSLQPIPTTLNSQSLLDIRI